MTRIANGCSRPISPLLINCKGIDCTSTFDVNCLLSHTRFSEIITFQHALPLQLYAYFLLQQQQSLVIHFCLSTIYNTCCKSLQPFPLYIQFLVGMQPLVLSFKVIQESYQRAYAQPVPSLLHRLKLAIPTRLIFNVLFCNNIKEEEIYCPRHHFIRGNPSITACQGRIAKVYVFVLILLVL